MGKTPPDLDEPIGPIVKAWRESHGWSVTEYADLAGVSKSYVSEVERTKIAQPRAAQLRKLAAPFGISDWDLMSRRMPSNTSTVDPTDRTGTFAAPLSLDTDHQERHLPPFMHQLGATIEKAHLSPKQRARAERLILEIARVILKEEGER